MHDLDKSPSTSRLAKEIADSHETGKTGSINSIVEPRRFRGTNLFDALPGLKKIVKLRSFQFLLVFPNFIFFYIFLIAGIFGSPVGNRNIIIVLVWILWWFLLMTFMVPFLSRLWCIMCPFPLFGEWFQRRALIKVRSGRTGGLRNKVYGLSKRWPRKLTNIWIQNVGFMLLGTFFVILATRPFVSALVLGGLFVLATGLAVVYQRRVFCSYLCPVSGFLGLYSMSSMIELRAVDPEVCAMCKTKSCATGNELGWACPWFLNVATLHRNNFCGLCMECVKSCTNKNIGLFTRPLFSDTEMKGFDEAWKAFIMLALAFVYAVVLQGPWGFVKTWANVTEAGNWKGFLGFAGIVWVTSFAIFPALWGIAIGLGRYFSGSNNVSWKKLFIGYSYILVPLGLFAWIAFSLPLVMVNGSYVISVLSDPLGRGWNIFGTAQLPWKPFYPEYAIYIQVILLLLGLGFSIKKGVEIGTAFFDDNRTIVRSLLPIMVLCVLITLGFLKVFAG